MAFNSNNPLLFLNSSYIILLKYLTFINEAACSEQRVNKTGNFPAYKIDQLWVKLLLLIQI